MLIICVQGDSGGPLAADGEQIGVVSWGIPCAKGRPDVFTRVFPYRSWIDKHVEENDSAWRITSRSWIFLTSNYKICNEQR